MTTENHDYPEIQIGRERNEAGELLVRVGGALCGTVEAWKSLIAQAEMNHSVKVFDPRDPSFRESVLTVFRDAKKRRVI